MNSKNWLCSLFLLLRRNNKVHPEVLPNVPPATTTPEPQSQSSAGPDSTHPGEDRVGAPTAGKHKDGVGEAAAAPSQPLTPLSSSATGSSPAPTTSVTEEADPLHAYIGDGGADSDTQMDILEALMTDVSGRISQMKAALPSGKTPPGEPSAAPGGEKGAKELQDIIRAVSRRCCELSLPIRRLQSATKSLELMKRLDVIMTMATACGRELSECPSHDGDKPAHPGPRSKMATYWSRVKKRLKKSLRWLEKNLIWLAVFNFVVGLPIGFGIPALTIVLLVVLSVPVALSIGIASYDAYLLLTFKV